MRTVTATRYVTPLREGGSMPGLVEADDDGLYVLKFRAAGQGVKALVAEVMAGEVARALGLPVPELVLVELDPELGRAEPDPEIQHLLRGSPGLNLGMDFLPGALAYGPEGDAAPSPELAADVVWFDALVTNVDRTPRNPNLLLWHGRLWLIDHGAALYAHHGWHRPGRAGGAPVPRDPRSRAAARGRLGRGRRRAAGGAHRRRAAGGDRGGGAGAVARGRSRRAAPRARRLPAPAARAAASLRGGGRACPSRRVARSSTRSCGSCRAWSAGSASTRASCCTAARGASSAARVALDETRLRALAPDADAAAVDAHLQSLARIAAGDPGAGPIAALDASERFHWLVSPSSTIVQPSDVHTGLSDDPATTLDHLFETLVD